MKLLTAISIAILAIGGTWASRSSSQLAQMKSETVVETEEISDFEKAVKIIKKYEGLHQPKHYPLVGYGHLVLPGEKYSRSKAMGEKEAEALLRKDLLKNCAVFRSYGADSLILGVLAYNIGSGATKRSSVAKKLAAGDRNIYENYIAHSRYKGKVHKQIQQRRIEEFETLFIKDPASSKGNKTEKNQSVTPNTTNSRPIELESLSGWNILSTLGKAFRPYLTISNNILTCILKSQPYSSL